VWRKRDAEKLAVTRFDGERLFGALLAADLVAGVPMDREPWFGWRRESSEPGGFGVGLLVIDGIQVGLGQRYEADINHAGQSFIGRPDGAATAKPTVA
jgi:hypothetical protein